MSLCRRAPPIRDEETPSMAGASDLGTPPGFRNLPGGWLETGLRRGVQVGRFLELIR